MLDQALLKRLKRLSDSDQKFIERDSDLMAVSEQRWTGAALKWPGAGEYAHKQHPPHVQLPSSQREH